MTILGCPACGERLIHDRQRVCGICSGKARGRLAGAAVLAFLVAAAVAYFAPGFLPEKLEVKHGVAHILDDPCGPFRGSGRDQGTVGGAVVFPGRSVWSPGPGLSGVHICNRAAEAGVFHLPNGPQMPALRGTHCGGSAGVPVLRAGSCGRKNHLEVHGLRREGRRGSGSVRVRVEADDV